ncbi:MAG: hypothetical protein ACP5VF_13050 [Acidobacteriota bacterium]
MTSEWTVRALQELLDEAEDQDRFNQTKYRQMVSVMAPVNLLQRVDHLVEETPGLTRETVLIRALHVYLTVLGRACRMEGPASAGVDLSRGGDECTD